MFSWQVLGLVIAGLTSVIYLPTVQGSFNISSYGNENYTCSNDTDCLNGGSCVNTICICLDEYVGLFCEIQWLNTTTLNEGDGGDDEDDDVIVDNQCLSGYCNYGGKCSEGTIGEAACVCPTGTYGDHCQTHTSSVSIDVPLFINASHKLITSRAHEMSRFAFEIGSRCSAFTIALSNEFNDGASSTAWLVDFSSTSVSISYQCGDAAYCPSEVYEDVWHVWYYACEPGRRYWLTYGDGIITLGEGLNEHANYTVLLQSQINERTEQYLWDLTHITMVTQFDSTVISIPTGCNQTWLGSQYQVTSSYDYMLHTCSWAVHVDQPPADCSGLRFSGTWRRCVDGDLITIAGTSVSCEEKIAFLLLDDANAQVTLNIGNSNSSSFHGEFVSLTNLDGDLNEDEVDAIQHDKYYRCMNELDQSSETNMYDLVDGVLQNDEVKRQKACVADEKFLNCLLESLYHDCQVNYDSSLADMIAFDLSMLDMSGFFIHCDIEIPFELGGQCSNMSNSLQQVTTEANNVRLYSEMDVCRSYQHMIDVYKEHDAQNLHCPFYQPIVKSRMAAMFMKPIQDQFNCHFLLTLPDGTVEDPEFQCEFDCYTCQEMEPHLECLRDEVYSIFEASDFQMKSPKAFMSLLLARVMLYVTYISPGMQDHMYDQSQHDLWMNNREAVCRSTDTSEILDISQCILEGTSDGRCGYDEYPWHPSYDYGDSMDWYGDWNYGNGSGDDFYNEWYNYWNNDWYNDWYDDWNNDWYSSWDDDWYNDWNDEWYSSWDEDWYDDWYSLLDDDWYNDWNNDWYSSWDDDWYNDWNNDWYSSWDDDWSDWNTDWYSSWDDDWYNDWYSSWDDDWYNDWYDDWNTDWYSSWDDDWYNDWYSSWDDDWYNDWYDDWNTDWYSSWDDDWYNDWYSSWDDDWYNDWYDDWNTDWYDYSGSGWNNDWNNDMHYDWSGDTPNEWGSGWYDSAQYDWKMGLTQRKKRNTRENMVFEDIPRMDEIISKAIYDSMCLEECDIAMSNYERIGSCKRRLDSMYGYTLSSPMMFESLCDAYNCLVDLTDRCAPIQAALIPVEYVDLDCSDQAIQDAFQSWNENTFDDWFSDFDSVFPVMPANDDSGEISDADVISGLINMISRSSVTIPLSWMVFIGLTLLMTVT